MNSSIQRIVGYSTSLESNEKTFSGITPAQRIAQPSRIGSRVAVRSPVRAGENRQGKVWGNPTERKIALNGKFGGKLNWWKLNEWKQKNEWKALSPPLYIFDIEAEWGV